MWAVGYILDFDSDSWLLKGFLLIILFFLTSLFPRCVLVFAKLVIAFPIWVLFFLLLLAGATDFYWAMNVTYHIEWSLRCEGRALVVYDLTKSKSVNPVIKLHWQLVENKYPSSLFFPGSLFELLMNNGKIFVTILHLGTFLPIFQKLFFSILNLNSF